MTTLGDGGLLRGHGDNVLKLDGGDASTTLQTHEMPLNCLLNFI